MTLSDALMLTGGCLLVVALISSLFSIDHGKQYNWEFLAIFLLLVGTVCIVVSFWWKALL